MGAAVAVADGCGRAAVITSLGLHGPSPTSVHPRGVHLPVQALCILVLGHMGVSPGQQGLEGLEASGGHGQRATAPW